MQRTLFVSDVALFPAGWTHDFEAGWQGGQYPAEATSLALRSYRAARTVLEALVAAERPGRDELASGLAGRLTLGTFEAEGLDAFARSVRMIRDDEIVPFPVDIFRETWQHALAIETLGPDSLLADIAPADSVFSAPPEETVPASSTP